MSDQVVEAKNKPAISTGTVLMLLLPLLVLGGIIYLFLQTGGGLNFRSPAPVERVTVERTILAPGQMQFVLRNTSPQDVTIAQASINAAIWPLTVSPSPTIPRLGSATVTIPYMWVEGESYSVTLFTTNSIPINIDIPVAVQTAQPTSATFLGFTLIGIYVGVIPIYLGLLWFPALRRMGKTSMTFLLAMTIGILVFLGLDAINEALEASAEVAGSFQGIGLIGLGGIATFLLLDAIGKQQSVVGRSDAERRMSVAFLIALGIGLHNLGEGLAIGAAYNLGEIALGTFLVVGFIIQNITEGLGIIAPVVRDRPPVQKLALMGLLGGGPAIVGSWVGGFAPNPTLAVLFLGIGAGAIFEVVFEIAKLINRDTEKNPMPMTVFAGVVGGMLVMWGTGLFIK